MARIAGRLQSVDIDAVAIGCIVDASISGENAELDTTCHDDLDARAYIYGRFSGTMDLTMKWDEADAGQIDLADAFFGKTINVYTFRMQTGTGFQLYTVSGLVTSFSPSAPNDDVAELTATIRLTGAIVRSAQP